MIPARLRSQRLPEKLLLSDTGRPLIQYTVQAALQSFAARAVVVATDSMAIANAVEGLCAVWLDPEDDSWCGTQRAARALAQLPDHFSDGEVLANWQADEPLLPIADVDRALRTARDRFRFNGVDVVTICHHQTTTAWDDRDQPKVLLHREYRAVDFYRALPERHRVYDHIGFYALSPARMAQMTVEQPSVRAIAESLEQLTWIDEQWQVDVVKSRHRPASINTRADYRRFVQHVTARGPEP